MAYAASDDGISEDYDVISSVSSSIGDLGAEREKERTSEPPPGARARAQYAPANYTGEEVQAYVRRYLANTGNTSAAGGVESERRVVRVYVDGVFDGVHVGQALQLRQAKLSFAAVHLLVGVIGAAGAGLPHAERCELVRHVRWVDEVLAEAPLCLDEAFLRRHRIDYVAVEEGSSVSPELERERVRGYDAMKAIGKVIPTRRTAGVVGAQPRALTRVDDAATPLADEHEPEPPGTPRSPLPLFEDGPPLDIYGIGI